MNKGSYSDAFELAYGTGRQKKWARERLIMDNNMAYEFLLFIAVLFQAPFRFRL